MIGNDIVDFQKAELESNWHRKGYLDKLFNKTEQELIFDSADPNQMVWLFWSMKEACYKSHFRDSGIRSYKPIVITCSNLLVDESSASGEIHYDNHVYYSRSVLSKNFVHTYAVSHYSDFKNSTLFIEENTELKDNTEKKNFNDYHNFRRKNDLLAYRIIKSRYNIPHLLNIVTGEQLPLSVSHHGRFLSFAFLKLIIDDTP